MTTSTKGAETLENLAGLAGQIFEGFAISVADALNVSVGFKVPMGINSASKLRRQPNTTHSYTSRDLI